MAGEKVLVIDDSAETLRIMRELVSGSHGYSFLGAKDGQEGLRKALTENPDLIILDLKMPKMTGWEVMDALQKRQRDIPVILMTAHGSEEIAVQAFRLRVKDYIIKPFEAEEMLAAIDRALTERHLRAEKERLTQQVLKINKELEHRLKERAVLYAIGQSMTSLLNLQELLDRIVEAAVFVTGAEEGSLLLVDKDTGELYLRAARGLGEKFARGFRLKVEDSIAGQVVETGQPILQNTQGKERLKVSTGYLVKSLVNVPLKTKGEVIGILAVDNKISTKPFTDNDIYLLSALADYAAIAIENARLYQDTGEKAAQLDTLLEIAQSITSRLDLEGVLQMIVDSAVTKLGADVATLYLYDPIRDEFPAPVIAGHIDHPEEMIPPTKDSVVYRMLRQEGLYLAHDAQNDAVMARGFTQREKIQSSAGFSLRVGGEPVGAMFVNYRKPHLFTEGEKNIFTLFAQSAAIAIQNAKLYKDARGELAATEAVAWMGILGSSWSHGVNQKSFAIRNYVEVLRALVPPEPRVENVLSQIEAAADEIKNIPITQPLPTTPGTSHGVVEIDDALQKQVQKWCRPRQDILVQFDLHCPHLRAQIDREWLAVALEKLVSNALKAMTDGGTLTVFSERVGDQVRIHLTDTGHGIPDYAREHFLKDRIQKEDDGGTGVGVLIARLIFRRYGGELSLLWTETGRGTTLEILLPAEGTSLPA